MCRRFDSVLSHHFLFEDTMAIVAKWLTHLIVVQAFVGSIPISRPIFSYINCAGVV
jgi:hypothetical protein